LRVLTIGRGGGRDPQVKVAATYVCNLPTTKAGSATAISNGSSSDTRTATTGNNLLALLGATGTLDFTGATIKVVAGTLGSNWDSGKFYSWLLATTPAGSTVTLPGNLTFDTSGFAPAPGGGGFALGWAPISGNVYLNCARVPESADVLLICAAAAGACVGIRRLRRRQMRSCPWRLRVCPGQMPGTRGRSNCPIPLQ